ncbi:MAG: hypothetical protein CEN91_532, partial [Candidatus Berkelbacteria bacterium Licking1014_85]
MFKNLKIEKRNTKVFIIKTKNKVIKIPYTPKSWKENQQEMAVIKEVQEDPHFFSYLLEYKYIFGCPITRRFSPIKESRENKRLVRKYFQKAFQDAGAWGKKPLRYLLDADFFLDFILKSVPASQYCLARFIDTNRVPQSSAHSDFHQKNILAEGDKLYFIDWSRYKRNSSRYFDLLDFYVYLKGKKYE